MKPRNGFSSTRNQYGAYWELIIRALGLKETRSFTPTLLELCCGRSELLHYIDTSPYENQPSFDYIGIDLQHITYSDCQMQWSESDKESAFSRRTSKIEESATKNGNKHDSNYQTQNGSRYFSQQDALEHKAIASIVSKQDKNPVNMVFCRIPFTASNDDESANGQLDWRFIESALELLDETNGKAVLVAPMRMLKPDRDDEAAKRVISSNRIASVTLLEEGWDLRKPVKVALMVLDRNQHKTIRVVNATGVSKAVSKSGDTPTRTTTSGANSDDLQKNEIDAIFEAWTNKVSPIPSLDAEPSDLFFSKGEADGSFVNRMLLNNEEKRTIGDICYVSRGISKKEVLKKHEDARAGHNARYYPYVTASDLIDGEIAVQGHSMRCIAQGKATMVDIRTPSSAQKRAMLKPPVILVSRNGYPFKISYIGHDADYPIIPSDSLYAIQSGFEDDLLLCFAHLMSDKGQSELRAASSGSAISQISQNAIKNIAIPDYSPDIKDDVIRNVFDELVSQSRRMMSLLDEADLIERSRRHLLPTLENLQNALRDRFDEEKDLSADQKEAMRAIVLGRDVFVTTTPGQNAPLIYQASVAALGGTTVVVSTSPAFAEQQVEKIKNHLHSGYLDDPRTNSKADKVHSLLEQVRNGELQILYVTPSYLSNEEFLNAIGNADVPLVVVEETQRTNNPDSTLNEICDQTRAFINCLRHRPVVAVFLATTTSKTKRYIAETLNMRNPLSVELRVD